MEKVKSSKQLERRFKGMANHRRLDIIFLISNEQCITTNDIAKELQAKFKTISLHTRALVYAGLMDKKYKGRKVVHTLSPYGKIFVEFTRKFQRISYH